MVKREAVLVCPPRITEYKTTGSPVSVPLAYIQYDNMLAELVRRGIRIVKIADKSGSPDAVFIRDPFIETPTHTVVAKFRNPMRVKETINVYETSPSGASSNPKKPDYIVERGFLEGGDYLCDRGISFIMAGPRTSRLAIRDMMMADVFGTVKVARITSGNSTIIHLDLMLGFIDDVAVIWSGAKRFVVDVYERTGRQIASLPLSEYLKHLGYTLFEITDKEQRDFVCNFVVFDKFVLATEGSQRLAGATQKPVVCVPLSEFKKMGGGVHCLMNK